MSREVKIQCPQCKSGYHKIIKFAGNDLIYQCSCGKNFKATFDIICISCDIIDNIQLGGITMKKLETMNTRHNRGEVEYNSPTSYEISSKLTNQFIQRIDIQKGPIQHAGEVNGIFVEDLILICIDQLEHFQDSSYACEENERTLHHLKCALDTTRARQYDRIIRGVQGRMQK